MPEPAVPRTEAVYQRLRAWRDGRLIIDSHDAHLYFGDPHHPRWAVPVQDLRVAATTIGAHQVGELVVLEPDAADLWLEEDHPVYGAPKNPYHRVDVLASSRTVRLSVAGEVVADTTRPVLLIETGVVPRWYVPPADVAWERLVADPARTVCQYKGVASYYRVDGTDVRLWSYQHPDPDVAAISGMLAAAAETPGVEIIVDRTPQQHL
jgi:uncharacterized protein (DUF427 family)